MAVRVKREPGVGRDLRLRVCFVCGETGVGAVHYPLHVRPRDRGSYYPFLEQHEVPDGASSPSADGAVMACTVCYSFLEQQWESFERSRTPHSKRLYWLKRVDNGHYIGAEMRCQSEYAAQVIGVSPEPMMTTSTGHGHCSATSQHQHHQQTRVQQQQQQQTRFMERRNSLPNEHHQRTETSRATEPSRSNSAIYYNALDQDDSRIASSALLDLSKEAQVSEQTQQQPPPQQSTISTDESVAQPNDALDLSMPDKNAATEVCYLCGDECPRGTLVSVYAKPIANCPFFPSLTSHPRPSRSHPMDPSGCVQACSPCHQHLLQQWDAFQKLNAPHADRHYRLRKQRSSFVGGRIGSSPVRATPPAAPQPPTRFVCLLCAGEFAWNLRHFLYSGSNPEGEPAHPFLERVKPPIGAHPLSATGQAIVCAGCYTTMHKQLLQAEQQAEQQQQQQQQQQPIRAPSRKNSDLVEQQNVVCHSCRLAIAKRHTVRLDFVPVKEPGRPFFPFPATDDDSLGVPVCTACHASYRAQWETFEMDRVPHPFRYYVLPARPDTSDVTRPPSRPRRVSRMEENHLQSALQDVTPLRIHVPTPDQDQANPGSQNPGGQGGGGASLLATVSTTSDSPVSLVSVGHHSRHFGGTGGGGSNALDLSTCNSGGRSVTALRSSTAEIRHPSERDHHRVVNNKMSCVSSSSSSAAPTVCYVCGLRIKNTKTKTYVVRSYPTRSSSVDDGGRSEHHHHPHHRHPPHSSSPFFPFVTLHSAPVDASPVADDGTVITCTFCYHTLMVQWATYESSSSSSSAVTTNGGGGGGGAPHPSDLNPWTRVYDCHDYVCYVCGVTTYRKRVKAIAVSDFPFLVEHPPPHGALVLDGGDAVTVCLMCYDTLHDQWKDFERMKVPVELRKYNWIAAPPPPEDDDDDQAPTNGIVPAAAALQPSAAKRSINGGGEGISVGRPLITIEDEEESRTASESSRQLDQHHHQQHQHQQQHQQPQQQQHHHHHHHHHHQHQQQQQRHEVHQRHPLPWDGQTTPGFVHNSKGPPPPPPLLPAAGGGGGGHMQSSKPTNSIRQHSGGAMSSLSQTTSTASYNSPSNSVTSNMMASANSRTSSFAAALRKLAKQAGDPVTEKELSPVSPVVTPPPPAAHSTTRRAPPPLVLAGDSGSHPARSLNAPTHGYSSSSTPSSSHLTYMDARKSLEHPMVNHSPRETIKSLYEEQRQGLESRDGVISRSSSNMSYLVDHRDGGDVAASAASKSSSTKMQGHQVEDGIKGVAILGSNVMGSGGVVSRAGSTGGGLTTGYYGDRGRDDQLMNVNGLPQSPQFHHLSRSQIMPSSGQSRLDHSHVSSSGSSFQPYRTPVDHALPPHHLGSPYETTPYGYHPAAFLQQHLTHPSFRLDDPLYLERYGVVRPPLFPLPHAGVLPHPHSLPFLSGAARYAPELLAHHLSLMSPTEHHHHLMMEQRRLKMEEAEQQQQQQRQRDHDMGQLQEQERKWEREKERSNDQAALAMHREQQQQQHLQQQQQQQERSQRSPWPQNVGSESPGGKVGSIMHGTPRDLVIRKTSSSSTSSLAPNHRKASSSSLPNHVTTGAEGIAADAAASAGRQQWGLHRFGMAAPSQQQILDGGYHLTESKDAIDHRLLPPNNDQSRKWSPVSDDQDTLRVNLVMPSTAKDLQRRKLSGNGYCVLQQQPSLPPLNSSLLVALGSSSSSSSHSRVTSALPQSPLLFRSLLEQNQEDRTQSKPLLQVNHALEHQSTDNSTSDLSGIDRLLQRKPVPLWPPQLSESVRDAAIGVELRAGSVSTESNSLPSTHVVHECSAITATSSMTTTTTTTTTVAVMPNHVDKGLIHGIDFLMSNAKNHLTHLKSKLDLEEERLRLRRCSNLKTDRSTEEADAGGSVGGDYDDDDDAEEDEDSRRTRLLTITCGLPLPLDSSPQKLTFLAQFGLTTMKRRRELDFDRFFRRQKRLRELSLSPIEKLSCDKYNLHADVLPLLQLALTKGPIRSSAAVDSLNCENSPEKMNLLKILGLCLVTKSKREELDEIQRAVWEERLRRNGVAIQRSLPAPIGEDLRGSREEPEIVEIKRVFKRKLEPTSPPCTTKSTRTTMTTTTATPTTTTTATTTMTTTMTSSFNNSADGKTSKPLAACLPNNSHSKSATKRRLLSADSKHGNGGGGTPSKNLKIHSDFRLTDSYATTTRSSSATIGAGAVVGKDFAQEFHESVLLQTSKTSKPEMRVDRFAESESPSLGLLLPALENSRPRDETSPRPSSLHRNYVQMRWPGVEVLMEAYESYQQEQKLELEVLLEHCSRLRTRNQDLNNVAENLSKSMADLIQQKIELDNERRQQHAAIDNLKCLMKQMR